MKWLLLAVGVVAGIVAITSFFAGYYNDAAVGAVLSIFAGGGYMVVLSKENP